MEWIDLRDRLAALTNPVFTPTRIAAVSKIDRASATKMLRRQMEKGRVIAIERGKYSLTGTNELQIASNVVYPSYISFLSIWSFSLSR